MGLRIEGRFQTSTTPASARSCLASPQKQPNARTKGQDRQCKRCEGCDFVAALWNENRAATSVHTGAAEPVEGTRRVYSGASAMQPRARVTVFRQRAPRAARDLTGRAGRPSRGRGVSRVVRELISMEVLYER